MADYHITNVTELQNMSAHLADDCYLDNDIDAFATVGWNGGAGFIPIGTLANPFTGSFDGKGHKIVGLYINRPLTSYVGLFGRKTLGGETKNVGIEQANITGYNYTGILAGQFRQDGGFVSDCYTTGVVVGYNTVGGLCG